MTSDGLQPISYDCFQWLPMVFVWFPMVFKCFPMIFLCFLIFPMVVVWFPTAEAARPEFLATLAIVSAQLGALSEHWKDRIVACWQRLAGQSVWPYVACLPCNHQIIVMYRHILSYTFIYFHPPPYTVIYIHIPAYTSIYLQIFNIRNMTAHMRPKNGHISCPRPFPKVRIRHSAS